MHEIALVFTQLWDIAVHVTVLIALPMAELCAIGICVQLILISDERVQRLPVWIERDRQRTLGYQDDMYRESVATWVRTLYRHEWFKNLRK